jgi:hypothetical protein
VTKLCTLERVKVHKELENVKEGSRRLLFEDWGGSKGRGSESAEGL